MDEISVVFEKATISLFLRDSFWCMATIAIACLGVDDVAPILRATYQFVVVALLAKCLCQLGYSEVVEGIFQCARCLLVLMEGLFHSIFQRDVAILDIAVECTAPHTILVILKVSWSLESILAHSLVGLFVVEIPYTFYICISQHGMVANHCCCVRVPTRKDG